MRIFSTSTGIAIGFGCIIVSAILGAHMTGLFPDADTLLTRQRLQLMQVVAAQCSAAADRNDAPALRAALDSVLSNNPDVASAGLRAPDGKLVMSVGPHAQLWRPLSDNKDPALFEAAAPVRQQNHDWATLEMRFAPLPGTSFLSNPLVRVTLFVAGASFCGALLFLRKALKHLDPSSVIPDRVRAMLDALAEGVVVLDLSGQIVMANSSFCQIIDTPLPAIQGRKVANLRPLVDRLAKDQAAAFVQATNAAQPVHRLPLRLNSSNGEGRSLVVTLVPVLGNDGSHRGLLATFDDITSIENTNAQLRGTLRELAESRDEIARQNKELQSLASRDPLTGCFNRRAFMRSFQEMWNKAVATNASLGCIMLDIDHFKSINDRYGHAVGDQVLKSMGKVLHESCRGEDLICRYGGEEFCVLLPGASFEVAHRAAERIRQGILNAHWPIETVTSSIGVTGIEAGAPDTRRLLEQADKALYAAKKSGRNRVIAWGDPAIDATASQQPEERRSGDSTRQLKQVANALIHALAQRDQPTADHSQRVADLTTLMFDPSACAEQVELARIAALLHDVGKIAVPDSVLHKPGPLDREEWEVMRKHEGVGAELVQEAIGHPDLTAIVRHHHAWFGGTPAAPQLPTGSAIPLASRCIAIADAYDAMTTDRPYRKALSHDDARNELQRLAGAQFDPDLLQVFMAKIDGHLLRQLAAARDVAQSSSAHAEKLAAQAAEIASLANAAANPGTSPKSLLPRHPVS